MIALDRNAAIGLWKLTGSESLYYNGVMAQTWEEMIEEVKTSFNHICIVHDTRIARIVGIGSDFMDVYYIGMELHKDGLQYYSFVGPCESLKGKVERYDNLDSVFSMNRCPPQDEFLVKESTPEEDAVNAAWFRFKQQQMLGD